MSDSFSTAYQGYQNRVANSIKNHRRIINQLQSILIQRKDIQEAIYNDMLTHCIESWRVVEDIVRDDINIGSIEKHNMMVDQEGGTYDRNTGEECNNGGNNS